MNKKLLVLLLICFATQINAMKRIESPSIEHLQRKLIKKEKRLYICSCKCTCSSQATPQHNDSITFAYPFLPIELIECIIVYGSESLTHAGKIMSNFIQTNKKTYYFLDDDKNCLQLIKQLSEQFKSSDEITADSLKTRSARLRHGFQKSFIEQCMQFRATNSKLDPYKENNVDLNFTYEPNGCTALMKTCSYPNPNPSAARWLLANNAKFNHIIKLRIHSLPSLVDQEPHHITQSKYHTIQYICQIPRILPNALKHSDFNVNFQDKEGNTPLIFLLKFLCAWTHPKEDVEEIYEGIHFLLQNNANPELANEKKQTPLFFAQQYTKDQRFSQLIQEVIDKKHAPDLSKASSGK